MYIPRGVEAAYLVARDILDDGVPNDPGHGLFTISVSFVCLSAALVSARFYTRVFINKHVGSDDWVILVALLLAIGLSICYCGEARNGYGLHVKELSTEHKIQADTFFYGAQIFYKLATCATKASLLLLYLRIFTSPWFRRGAWTVMAVVIGYGFATTVASIFQCTPVSKAWNKSLPGTCISAGATWYATAGLALITDIAIIVLPLWEIAQLKMKKAQKAGLMFIFGLGIFVILCTVIRISKLGPSVSAGDSTYYQAFSNSWTAIEVNVGIICATLPTIKAFGVIVFKDFINKTFRSGSRSRTSQRKGSDYGSSFRDRSRRKSSIPISNPMITWSSKPATTSDEVMMLGELQKKGSIIRTTEVALTYEGHDSLR